MINKKIIISLTILCLILTIVPAISKNAKSYFNEANTMLISGKFERAANLYNLALTDNPEYSEAYLGLGMAYKELNKYDEAYAAITKAIKLKPDYYPAYYNLGLILEKQEKYDLAIESYEKFLKEVPGAERFSDAKQRILKIKKLK